MKMENDQPLKKGTLAVLIPSRVSLSSVQRGQVPWYKDITSLMPTGFLSPGTHVLVDEFGPFFCRCISEAGRVYFRLENIQKVP